MAIERYNAREAEARWQKVWDERGIFVTRNEDPRQKSRRRDNAEKQNEPN